MIAGKIASDEALIQLDVTGHARSPRPIEAVIDTGYNGYLRKENSW